MKSLYKVYEGMFDVDDNLEKIGKDIYLDSLKSKLEEFGMDDVVKKGDVWYCTTFRTLNLDNQKIREFPEGLDTLAVRGNRILITGDLKKSEIKKIYSPEPIDIKIPKIEGIEFRGNNTDSFTDGIRHSDTDISFKRGTKVATNCEFYDIKKMAFDSSMKFSNCKFQTKLGNADFNILFDGTEEQREEWIGKVCNCEPPTKQNKYDVPDLALRLLKHFNIELENRNVIHVNIACTKQSKTLLEIMYMTPKIFNVSWFESKTAIRIIKSAVGK